MRLRILTYNIHKGFNTFGNQFVLQEIKQSLRTTHADILFLQEVVGENQDHQTAIDSWPTEPQFEYLADSVWTHFSYGKNAIFPNRHHGNAILSKFPIEFSENLNISNHKLEQRGLLHCRVLLPELGSSLHLFNTHIDLLASGRKKQIAKIRDRIVSHSNLSEPLIFCGDFNDWTRDIPGWLEPDLHLREAHTVLHGGPAKSFPGFFPVLHLDRVYFRGINPISCQTLQGRPWNRLSDHLPLLAEFELY
jgi:endonuclease/exonuclease/phosphatase family metal-dependent hydrolase